MVEVEVVVVEVEVVVVVNYRTYNRMNPTERFFLLYIAVCFSIMILFYFIFKRSEVLPILPYAFQTASKPISQDPLRQKIKKEMNKGIPGMERGKPLPPPKMPVAPLPLIVRT